MLKYKQWLAKVFADSPRQEYADALSEEGWQYFIEQTNPRPLSYLFTNYIRLPEKILFMLWKIYINRWSQQYVAKEYIQHFTWEMMLEKFTPRQICHTLDTFVTYKIDPPGVLDTSFVKKKLFRKILKKDDWATRLIDKLDSIYAVPKFWRICGDLLYSMYYCNNYATHSPSEAMITAKEHKELCKMTETYRSRDERADWTQIAKKVLLENGACHAKLTDALIRLGYHDELVSQTKEGANGKPSAEVPAQPVLQPDHA